ncbi:unnamed protein product [Trifolium pratense]|uniref:Uncharacterized protein n=1 Tax=Trifolium pratense TaxID=57577 RepID=A0ACB0JDK4_TRIPR|nr:unnamed protein product [Trifolium pratense]
MLLKTCNRPAITASQQLLLYSHSNNTCHVFCSSLPHNSQVTGHCTWCFRSCILVGRHSRQIRQMIIRLFQIGLSFISSLPNFIKGTIVGKLFFLFLIVPKPILMKSYLSKRPKVEYPVLFSFRKLPSEHTLLWNVTSKRWCF